MPAGILFQVASLFRPEFVLSAQCRRQLGPRHSKRSIILEGWQTQCICPRGGCVDSALYLIHICTSCILRPGGHLVRGLLAAGRQGARARGICQTERAARLK